MLRIALKCLFHERGKCAAAIAGVAFSACLVTSEIGIYVGFLRACSGLIAHSGGDVWVMKRGLKAIDYGRPIAESHRSRLLEAPCVKRVRAVVTARVPVQKVADAEINVFLVGVEPPDGHSIPWNLARGVPADLAGPLRVAVDLSDRARLGIPEGGLGSTFQLGGELARVVALTTGIKAFSLAPYVFTGIDTARWVGGLRTGESCFWVADLENESCAADVIRFIGADPEVEALTTEDFRERTETHWLKGSGAGLAIGFSALLSSIVGVVIAMPSPRTTSSSFRPGRPSALPCQSYWRSSAGNHAFSPWWAGAPVWPYRYCSRSGRRSGG
jgi:putative ABC transport system permease protein